MTETAGTSANAGSAGQEGAGTTAEARSRLVGLLRPLFPEEQAPSTSRRLTALIGVLVALVAAATFAMRFPVGQWDSLWAEDGDTFLQDGLAGPWWRELIDPYAGYLNVVPRLAGEAAAHVPIGQAPYVFVSVAAAVVGGVAWAVWAFSAGHVRSPLLRLALAAAVVLVPGGGLEAVGSVANSHFYLMYGAFWTLLARPRGVGGVVLASLLVGASALSDAQTLVLLPLAVARLLTVPGRRERWVVVTFAVTMAVQLGVVLSSERTIGEVPAVGDFLFGYAVRVVSRTVLGLDGTEALTAAHGGGAAGFVTVGVLALVVVGMAAGRPGRLLILAAAVTSVTYFAMPSYFAMAEVFPPAGASAFDLGPGGRYTILPSLLLYTALLVSVQALVRRTPPPGAAPVLALALVPVAVWAATDYRPVPGFRTLVPAWSVGVEQLREVCATRTAADIPIEPGGPWNIRLPCAQVGA